MDILANNSNKISKFLYFCLCFGLCLYQIIKICEIYFSYETTVSMSYENSLQISLPSISVCFDKQFVIKPEFYEQMRAKNMFSENEVNDRQMIVEFMNENQTMRQQIEVMYNFEDIFNNSCRVLTTIGINFTEDYISCQMVSKIRQSVDYKWNCFSLLSQLDEEPDERYIADYNRRLFKDFNFGLIYMTVRNDIPLATVVIHSRKERVFKFSDSGGLQMTQSWNSIKYHKTTIDLLGKPYKTNCFDYRQKGFNSRNDCINKCRLEMLRKAINGWPEFYANYDKESDEYLFRFHRKKLDAK